MNFWKKRIKNEDAIANKLGVGKEKIKELKNGEREVTGETLNKVLEAIEEENTNSEIKKVDILQWYKETDIKKLRIQFGYSSQTELAKIINCTPSNISRIENKERVEYSKTLEKLYYFFQNDFNRKKVNKKKFVNDDLDEKVLNWYNSTNLKDLRRIEGVKLVDRAREIGIPTSSLNDLEIHRISNYTKNMKLVYNFYNNEHGEEIKEDNKKEKILQWYKNNDLKQLREKINLSQKKVAKLINVRQPAISDIENNKNHGYSKAVEKLYNLYNNQEFVEEIQSNEKTNENENEIMTWYFNTDLKKLRGDTSLNQRAIEIGIAHSALWYIENKKKTKIGDAIVKVYEFYNKNKEEDNEEQVTSISEPEDIIVETTNQDSFEELIEENKVETSEGNEIELNYEEMYKNLVEEFNSQNKKLVESYNENFKLKMQIARYEKLIDRM